VSAAVSAAAPKMQAGADAYFALVPEWVLEDPKISDRAVRLYCRLSRFADYETGQAYPSRKLLAHLCRCSLPTIDRGMKELEAAGAVTSTPRFTDPDNPKVRTSNLYLLHRMAPS